MATADGGAVMPQRGNGGRRTNPACAGRVGAPSQLLRLATLYMQAADPFDAEADLDSDGGGAQLSQYCPLPGIVVG